MEKNTTELPVEVEELNKKNEELRAQLKEAEETIELIKKGNVDALVDVDKTNIKVYTEVTADQTFRILIEKMHEGAVTLDQSGIITYCNSFFAELMGLPLQKLMGTRLTDLINEDSKARFEDLISQGWKKNVKDELYLYSKDGHPLPLLGSLKKLELGKDVLLSIIFTDISVQKKSLEELKIKNEVLEESEKLAELGSWVVDLETNKVTVSNELYNIYGLEPVHDARSFTPFELIHQNDIAASKKIFETAVKDMGTFDIYTQIKIPPDNLEKNLHVKGKVLKKEGKAFRVIGVSQDVTAFLKAEQAKKDLVK